MWLSVRWSPDTLCVYITYWCDYHDVSWSHFLLPRTSLLILVCNVWCITGPISWLTPRNACSPLSLNGNYCTMKCSVAILCLTQSPIHTFVHCSTLTSCHAFEFWDKAKKGRRLSVTNLCLKNLPTFRLNALSGWKLREVWIPYWGHIIGRQSSIKVTSPSHELPILLLG